MDDVFRKRGLLAHRPPMGEGALEAPRVLGGAHGVTWIADDHGHGDSRLGCLLLDSELEREAILQEIVLLVHLTRSSSVPGR